MQRAKLLKIDDEICAGTTSSFQRRKYDVSYWKIDQFSKLSEKVNSCHTSPEMSMKGYNSRLYFYPNGRQSLFQGFFGLYFHSRESAEKKRFRLTLGVKTRSGRIEKWLSGIILHPDLFGFGSSSVIQRSEFLKRKEELAPSDCITFVAILHSGAPERIQDFADTTETGQAEEKEGDEKVLADMAKLLANGDRSDAMILVGEAKFRVHSCILAARTPVFAALFEHDTMEKETRTITVTDCEPTIFKEFLSYIYTGSAQNLNTENSLSLYQVADKYLVKDLKNMCREFLEDNLCPKTFCEVVQLALRCGHEDLLKCAFDYFAKNYKLIIRSVEWQQYIKENPMEANEILIKSFGPL